MVWVDPLDPFAVANVVGLLAFAIAGALKGADADLDLFGVVVLGVLTALGGGMLRDVLVGRVPVALTTTSDVTVVLVGLAFAVFLTRRLDRRLRDHPAFLLSDAVGLSAFAATGALVGAGAGVSPFGVVVLATLTGVGGGSLADLLLTRVPAVLREDFYATPAAVGGVAFVLARVAGLGAPVPSVACFGAALGLRVLALRYDWHLPSV
ncbi:trimeric intracellular cation channel family protein [Salinirubellus salinus]|uniref:Trimeric intracellular cation channel family protein n=1 Tax=Salinirubellus salinus TaxID=1364945 RepID=A0A9E7R2X8_9EURY|nr:trimeric intracellular cation channel family protein [Salinirubellus salinus]UWM54800.1 trimeric intracellular cation channel family protein [Salinirubellus salinus]